jgi:hypothetical protein
MRASILLLTAAAFALGPAALAEQPHSAPAAAQSADAAVVVAEVRRVIAERYVLPERRAALDAVLAEGLSSGRYRSGAPAELAEQINADLARVGQDGHLSFAYHPSHAANLAAARQARPDFSAFQRQARAGNFGIRELRVLPGNVRLMTYDGFVWQGEESARALDDAMRFLSGGDAVIIDVRGNGGGSPQAVQYIISHFLPPERPLVEFHMGGAPEPDRLSTLAELPAGRMIGKPLYVLTSRGSASAAEEFAGHVGGFRIGALVGSRTAGAAFRNELVPITGGFVLSVSVGRPVLAATGGDWERVGIAPTIETEPPLALDAAHAHALQRLAASAEGPERVRLAALADALAARATPRQPGHPLDAYAGAFGERSLRIENGRLIYQLAGRAPVPLVALGGDRFAFETNPLQQLAFDMDGAAARAFTLGERCHVGGSLGEATGALRTVALTLRLRWPAPARASSSCEGVRSPSARPHSGR